MASQFDEAFQEQLAAHYLRDDQFVASVGDLVSPDYFDNETLAALIAVQSIYLERYGATCTLKTYVQVMNKLIASKRVKIADMTEAKRLLGILHNHSLKDRQFVIDTIAEFARNQALGNSTMVLADALDSGDQSKISKALAEVEQAKDVGATDSMVAMDFTTSRKDRQNARAQRAAGGYTNGGITTGHEDLDAKLTPHRGWGRKELNILMAPPKGGKTAGMIHFCRKAVDAGFRVFYASCEVSEDIIGDRLDANISGVPMGELESKSAIVDKEVEKWEQKPGLGYMKVQAFPIRTLKVSDLKRILMKYKAQGIEFDLIAVDYLGIMKPEVHHQEKRHGLAEIGQDLRALATIFNAAVLTAYQTNREGTRKAKSYVSDGTDAADDYEVVRTADVLITINADEDMRQNGEVILYFSEMRNAESGLKLRYKQNLTNMRFLETFEGFQ